MRKFVSVVTLGACVLSLAVAPAFASDSASGNARAASSAGLPAGARNMAAQTACAQVQGKLVEVASTTNPTPIRDAAGNLIDCQVNNPGMVDANQPNMVYIVAGGAIIGALVVGGVLLSNNGSRPGVFPLRPLSP